MTASVVELHNLNDDKIEVVEAPRGRGRPPLPRDENGKIIPRDAQARKPRWNPKKWHPVYEDIVLLSCMGYKQYDIAAQKGLTVQHINNILNTESARIIKALVIKRIEDQSIKTMEERLDKCAILAVERMEETLKSDSYAERSPGGMFDKAVATLKFLGKSKEVKESRIENNATFVVTSHQMENLIAGIAAAKEARKLNLLPANV